MQRRCEPEVRHQRRERCGAIEPEDRIRLVRVHLLCPFLNRLRPRPELCPIVGQRHIEVQALLNAVTNQRQVLAEVPQTLRDTFPDLPYCIFDTQHDEATRRVQFPHQRIEACHIEGSEPEPCKVRQEPAIIFDTLIQETLGIVRVATKLLHNFVLRDTVSGAETGQLRRW